MLKPVNNWDQKEASEEFLHFSFEVADINNSYNGVNHASRFECLWNVTSRHIPQTTAKPEDA